MNKIVCPKREGLLQCTWWVCGCLNPETPAQVKVICNKEALHGKDSRV